MSQRVGSVLHVEDEMFDVTLVQRIFEKHGILNAIHRAANGIEALAMLRGGEGREPLEKPDLILLDMNMPRMGGIEFLRELRADPQLKDIIVVMLATHLRDEEKAVALDFSAAGLILKGEIAEDGSKLISLLEEFWCVPPGRSSPSKVLQLKPR